MLGRPLKQSREGAGAQGRGAAGSWAPPAGCSLLPGLPWGSGKGLRGPGVARVCAGPLLDAAWSMLRGVGLSVCGMGFGFSGEYGVK